MISSPFTPAFTPPTKALGDWLVVPSHASLELQRVRDRLPCASWLTGGAVRDMVLLGISAVPKDLDIVTSFPGEYDLIKFLLDLDFHIIGRGSRGGLKATRFGVTFDFWNLKDSLALAEIPETERSVTRLLQSFPLNIETIAVSLHWDCREVDLGFSQCLTDRCIRLNSTETMSVTDARTRADRLAEKFGFRVEFPA